MLKGALHQHSSLPELRRVVRFPLNPERLYRNQSAPAGRRLVETLRLELHLHAEDGNEAMDRNPEHGVYPLLAALEELFATQAQPPTGNLFELLSGNRPWVFLGFEWGERRMPVRIEELAVTERRFTTTLAPWHAVVQLRLRVLSSREAAAAPPARAMLDAYLSRRAAAARGD